MVTILHGDCIEVMRTLPERHFHTVVTSPPYWGLRSYEGEQSGVWGGEPECVHEWGERITENATNHTGKARWQHTRNGRDEEAPPEKRVAWLRTDVDQGNICGVCGAWRGALGLEPTPDRYVENMVTVFREVKRILRDDGTVWLNLGDSYWGGKGENGSSKARATAEDRGFVQSGGTVQMSKRPQDGRHEVCKPKDLVGIPWGVAFALRADGWWLRSDIIWAKPNPMPESVRDRPTRSHEYVFLLSKSARYYWDQDAVRLPMAAASVSRLAQDVEAQEGSHRAHAGGKTNGTMKAVRKPDKQRGHSRRHAGFNDRWDAMSKDEQQANGANIRSVWTIPTQPYAEAHFATFPEALVKPCILAGSPEGGHVLDPFGGSGTVGLVAQKAGRHATLIDLSPEYVALMHKRLAQRALPMGEWISFCHHPDAEVVAGNVVCAECD